MKIRPVGAELVHSDRRTGMTKLIFPFFRNIAKAHKKKQQLLFRLRFVELTRPSGMNALVGSKTI